MQCLIQLYPLIDSFSAAIFLSLEFSHFKILSSFHVLTTVSSRIYFQTVQSFSLVYSSTTKTPDASSCCPFFKTDSFPKTSGTRDVNKVTEIFLWKKWSKGKRKESRPFLFSAPRLHLLLFMSNALKNSLAIVHRWISDSTSENIKSSQKKNLHQWLRTCNSLKLELITSPPEGSKRTRKRASALSHAKRSWRFLDVSANWCAKRIERLLDGRCKQWRGFNRQLVDKESCDGK